MVVSSDLSQKVLDRLRALTIWHETGDVELACETFGMSRAAVSVAHSL